MIVGQSCTAHKSRTTVSDLCPTLKVCLVGRGLNVEKWAKQTKEVYSACSEIWNPVE